MKEILEIILSFLGRQVEREAEKIRRDLIRLSAAVVVLLAGGLLVCGGVASLIVALCLMLMRAGMTGPGVALTGGIVLLVMGGLVLAVAQRLGK